MSFSGGIPADGAGNQFDYNCFWNTNPNAPYGHQPGQLPLAQWRGTMGWDIHSIFADPKFISAQPTAARDFALQAGSPCIDAGIDVGQQADFLGAPVPHGPAPDMGAFEFGSSAPQPTGPAGPGLQRGRPVPRGAGGGRE